MYIFLCYIEAISTLLPTTLAMTDRLPFGIKSEIYVKVFGFLRNQAEAISRSLPLLHKVLCEQPNIMGGYKKVYYNEEDNTVLTLEIGPEIFLPRRRSLMKKLHAFRNDRGLLLLQEAETPYVFNYGGGNVCALVSSAERCSGDLFNFMTSRLERKEEVIDKEFYLDGLVALSKTVSGLLAAGLYFTDLKPENVVVCSDRLAFIDLDSIITEAEIRNGQAGAVSEPASKKFKFLQLLMIRTKSAYRGLRTDQRGRDYVRLHELYTLHAFSFMVFDIYFLLFRKDMSGNPLLFRNNPSFYLHFSDADLEEEMNDYFRFYTKRVRSKKRLMLMGYRILDLVYGGARSVTDRLMDTWFETLPSEVETREKKRQRRVNMLRESAKLLL